jgi:hypothetical protein
MWITKLARYATWFPMCLGPLPRSTINGFKLSSNKGLAHTAGFLCTDAKPLELSPVVDNFDN